jgi:serine phosphatase RsbU (regulator of sigma subunit)
MIRHDLSVPVRRTPAPFDRSGAHSHPAGERLRVLLIEDDPADAFLVEELLSEARAPIDLQIADSIAAARPRLHSVDCVLLDLRLPDANGLDALHQVLSEAAGVAVCVLTGLEDEHLGMAAVGSGAQDYLVKGHVDGVLLSRAVRYAVERRRADENASRLLEAELRQAESARLERGLLPKPLLDAASARVVSFYRPGRHRALLGGDFYDAVETASDRLHLLVGDVCGHGADEAALGVALRVAWRALVLAGVPDHAVLQSLEQVLVSERRSDELFATVAMVTVDLAGGRATVRLAGHPPPLLLSAGRVVECRTDPGLVLGVQPGLACPTVEVPLEGSDWMLLIYTDGLIEGRTAPAGDRLGVDGLCHLLADPQRPALSPHALPTWVVGQAEQRNGGPLADDVAMLLLTGSDATADADGTGLAGTADAHRAGLAGTADAVRAGLAGTADAVRAGLAGTADAVRAGLAGTAARAGAFSDGPTWSAGLAAPATADPACPPAGPGEQP